MTISIVIPTYKRVDELRRLLKSIENQTYRSFEVIIVDDHSPNQQEYHALISEFGGRISDLIYLSNENNRGAPHSRNRGILKAKYELIALVDDDDEWLPEKLEKQLQCLKQSKIKNPAIIYTWTDAINENGEVTYQYRATVKGCALSINLSECFIPSPSILIKKEALIKSGLFDEKMPSCQDWDMWTKVFLKGYECDVVEEVVTLYHKHSRESIGTSPRAKMGYLYFYRKHFWHLLRFAKFRHLIRFLKLSILLRK